MHEFIDTYVKLLIAMISFVIPLMVLLLSVFSKGASAIKKKYEQEQQELEGIIANQLANVVDYTTISKTINKSSKSLRWCKRINKYKLNLLNPIRQLCRIVISLFLALTLIMLDMIIKDKAFKLYNHLLSVFLIIGSFVCLFIGIVCLLQVGWISIHTKTIMEESLNPTNLSKEDSNIK